jgi:cysteine desulfurase
MSYVNPFPKGVYLDHNASMPLLKSVREALACAILKNEELFSNPSSIHTLGQKGKETLYELKRELCELLGIKDTEEWILTSGATEAINTVLQSFGGKVLAYSSVDHAAVFDAHKFVPFKKTFELKVDRNGQLDRECLENFVKEVREGTLSEGSLKNDQVLLSWQLANNETGICFDLETLAWLKSQLKEKLFVMIDGAQAVGKLDESFIRLALHYADYFVFSGHKIGAPAGIGALWIRPQSPYQPLLNGGTQEKRRRAGTPNTLGIYGLRVALADWRKNGSRYRENMLQRRAELFSALSTLEGFVVHRNENSLNFLSNTLNFHFLDCTDESLVLALDLEKLYVSSGSACHSGSLKASHVLTAMGYTEEEALSSMRVCCGPETTAEEMALFTERLIHRVKHIRSSRSKWAELLPEMKINAMKASSIHETRVPS